MEGRFMALDMVNPRQHLSTVQSYMQTILYYMAVVTDDELLCIYQVMDIVLCSCVHLITLILFTYTEHCRLLKFFVLVLMQQRPTVQQCNSSTQAGGHMQA
jgi:hypothetical protein